jgi:hypothetical protein
MHEGDTMGDSVEEKKRRKNERRRQRYAEDPEFRERKQAINRRSKRKNKDAINARRRNRYATDPELRVKTRAQQFKSQREIALKRKYGISIEEYDARLTAQGGVCLICLRPSKKVLCVDHDHETRKLRDLLCDKCNRGLGYFDEDSAAMRRAADYLEYWQWRHADPCNTSPPPVAACSQQGSFAPNLPSIQSPPLTGEDMTPTDETNDESNAAALLKARRVAR